MPSNLFVLPPAVVAGEFLPAPEVQKLAGIRLTSPPGAWSDEVLQHLLRDNPYVPIDRAVVDLGRADETQGYAVGKITFIGAPQVSIPVIIEAGELQPLDLLVVGSQAEDANTGVGNVDDDKIVPLTERSFAAAMDNSHIGTVMRPTDARGTGFSEDGSQLRLPMRGRTVLASALGATAEQKAKLATVLEENRPFVAGFYLHGTAAVPEQWLNAPAPAHTLAQKIASAGVELPAAEVVTDFPVAVKTADLHAAPVFVGEGQVKQAVAFTAVSLHEPEAGGSRWLAFEDGTYCPAPDEVLTVKSAEANMGAVVETLRTLSLRRGTEVCFFVNDVFTVPAKIASIATDEANQSIEVRLTDAWGKPAIVTFARGVKTAERVEPGVWLFPHTTGVLQLSGYSEPPLSAAASVRMMEKMASATLVCAGAQYSLNLPGASVSLCQASKQAAADVLGMWFSNGDELLKLAEAKGAVRFRADVGKAENKVASLVKQAHEARKEAAALVEDIGLPLDKAVKLAAAIGREDGADAVLATGFLSEDNLAEFTSMAGEFTDTVNNLARLLLAIRMGYPGDENATAVAMKALQRVADRLTSVQQDLSSAPTVG